MRLPDELTAITDTLNASAGNSQLANKRVFWQGDLEAGDTVTVSLALTRETTTYSVWLPATAVIQDGVTDTLVRDIQLYLPPVIGYFPFIAKN
jgi:hypothetical protein